MPASRGFARTVPLKNGPPQANISAFDRGLVIKDLGGNASQASPIVVTPNGSDTIDGLASFSIVTPYDLIRLYSLTYLTGWMVG